MGSRIMLQQCSRGKMQNDNYFRKGFIFIGNSLPVASID